MCLLKKFFAVPSIVLSLCMAGFTGADKTVSRASNTEPAESVSAAQLGFRDAAIPAPPDWRGPRFKLSRDYPTQKPTCDAPWLKRKVSFSDPDPTWSPEWQAYVADIIGYVFAGQDPNLPDEIGWRTQVEGQTRWYNVPWMAYDGHGGREFVHGLTNELSTGKGTFRGPGRATATSHLIGAAMMDDKDPLFETWSVGYYNPCGAWSIGQGWPASGEPATYVDKSSGRTFAKGMPFPEGTVVIKILNTTADEDEVPYLAHSTTWQADAHRRLSSQTFTACARQVTKVHMIQMDLAVVDLRSPTRWVYSTLAYDGRLPGKTVKDRLRPLGVQWGNDVEAVSMLPYNVKLKETILSSINVPEHYGCQKRLAGVVDQQDSSCMSCHMAAFTAPGGTLEAQGINIPPIFNFDGICQIPNPANVSYFSDYPYPAAFPGGQFNAAIPLDSSLQLLTAFQEYAIYKNAGAPGAQSTCPNPSRSQQ